MICKCGKMMVEGKAEFKIYSVSLGNFNATVCGSCGAVKFDEASSDAIYKLMLEKGLYGLESRTKVGKVGDSLVIRLPKKIAGFVGLRKGFDVKLSPLDRHSLLVELPYFVDGTKMSSQISEDTKQTSVHENTKSNPEISKDTEQASLSKDT